MRMKWKNGNRAGRAPASRRGEIGGCEILALIALVAVVVHGVRHYMDNQRPPNRIKTAKIQIKATFTTPLDTFEVTVGRYPSTEEGLHALATTLPDNPRGRKQPILKTVPRDPWGNEYQYVYPGTHNRDSYDLWSFGPDGKPGGGGRHPELGRGRSGVIASQTLGLHGSAMGTILPFLLLV
jgi:general secretion pathway protein G